MIVKHWIMDLRSIAPRVHCITNYVTAGDVANAVLAVGGSPIMAQGRREVEDVTSICHSLVLNTGTMEERTPEAMILAGKRAMELGHPIILDPVGITASSFRRNAILNILKEISPSLIRGNESEIRALNQALSGLEPGNTCGVDSALEGTVEGRKREVQALAARTGAVAVMTGAEDMVGDGARVYRIFNGHPLMSRITGCGCMMDGVLGAVCGAFHGSRPELCETIAHAVAAYGLCGEQAGEKTSSMEGGTGNFRMYFMDFLSMLEDDMLERGEKIEVS